MKEMMFKKGVVYVNGDKGLWVKCLEPSNGDWKGVVVKTANRVYDVGEEGHWRGDSDWWTPSKEHRFKELMELYEASKK